MRVLIFGGRDWTNRDRTFTELDRLHQEHGFTQVIHGGARGADTLAGAWATSRGITVRVFPAQWKVHDPDRCDEWCYRRSYCPKAGFRRNTQMLEEGQPQLAVGFPGGNGTADMMKQCLAKGVTTFRAGQA